jgi:hypothetical protein
MGFEKFDQVFSSLIISLTMPMAICEKLHPWDFLIKDFGIAVRHTRQPASHAPSDGSAVANGSFKKKNQGFLCPVSFVVGSM